MICNTRRQTKNTNRWWNSHSKKSST